jgi:NAD(P)H-nitrite reductase large subunit
VDRGILTDNCQRTSLKDVFAAGDCTVSHDISTVSERILALLPNAYMQGEVCRPQFGRGGLRSFMTSDPDERHRLFPDSTSSPPVPIRASALPNRLKTVTEAVYPG